MAVATQVLPSLLPPCALPPCRDRGLTVQAFKAGPGGSPGTAAAAGGAVLPCACVCADTKLLGRADTALQQAAGCRPHRALSAIHAGPPLCCTCARCTATCLPRNRRLTLYLASASLPADFLDPMHHEAATGRPSINLDTWMLSRPQVAAAFRRHCAGADVAVVEGVMGLFDGRDGATEAGSTAQLAKWLGAPVVLVLDASALARSAAAVAKGYSEFDPALRLGGLLFNKVGGAAHTQWLRDALAAAGIGAAVLGGVPKVRWQPGVCAFGRALLLLLSKRALVACLPLPLMPLLPLLLHCRRTRAWRSLSATWACTCPKMPTCLPTCLLRWGPWWPRMSTSTRCWRWLPPQSCRQRARRPTAARWLAQRTWQEQ